MIDKSDMVLGIVLLAGIIICVGIVIATGALNDNSDNNDYTGTYAVYSFDDYDEDVSGDLFYDLAFIDGDISAIYREDGTVMYSITGYNNGNYTVVSDLDLNGNYILDRTLDLSSVVDFAGFTYSYSYLGKNPEQNVWIKEFYNSMGYQVTQLIYSDNSETLVGSTIYWIHITSYKTDSDKTNLIKFDYNIENNMVTDITYSATENSTNIISYNPFIKSFDRDPDSEGLDDRFGYIINEEIYSDIGSDSTGNYVKTIEINKESQLIISSSFNYDVTNYGYDYYLLRTNVTIPVAVMDDTVSATYKFNETGKITSEDELYNYMFVSGPSSVTYYQNGTVSYTVLNMYTIDNSFFYMVGTDKDLTGNVYWTGIVELDDVVDTNGFIPMYQYIIIDGNVEYLWQKIVKDGDQTLTYILYSDNSSALSGTSTVFRIELNIYIDTVPVQYIGKIAYTLDNNVVTGITYIVNSSIITSQKHHPFMTDYTSNASLGIVYIEDLPRAVYYYPDTEITINGETYVYSKEFEITTGLNMYMTLSSESLGYDYNEYIITSDINVPPAVGVNSSFTYVSTDNEGEYIYRFDVINSDNTGYTLNVYQIDGENSTLTNVITIPAPYHFIVSNMDDGTAIQTGITTFERYDGSIIPVEVYEFTYEGDRIVFYVNNCIVYGYECYAEGEIEPYSVGELTLYTIELPSA